ncbi:MAG: TolC family protein [Pseudomonadota bacterium]
MRRLYLSFGLAALGFHSAFAQNDAITSLPVRGNGSIRQPISLEPSGPLNLNTALQLALNANPEVSAAQHELNAQTGSILQAKALPNPAVSALMEDTRQATRTTTVQINQEVELGGKRTARTEVAERAYDIAAVELKTKRAQISAEVMAAFYSVLVSQERLRLVQSSLELAHSATQTAAKRVKAGRASPVEETKSTIAEASAKLELNQAQNALATARQQLTTFWGNAHPQFEKAEGQLDYTFVLPDFANLSNQIAASPVLQRAKLEIERQQALIKVENSRRVPNVTVTLGAKRDEQLGLNQAVLGVSIPIPVLNTNQGNIQEAVSRTEKAKDEHVAVQLRLSNELTAAYGRFTTSRQQMESLQQDILPSAQSAYTAARTGYELGKFNVLDVLDAQRTLFQSQLQYVNALADIHRAEADIYRVLGTTPITQPKELSHE